jgi:hypothetical protein
VTPACRVRLRAVIWLANARPGIKVEAISPPRNNTLNKSSPTLWALGIIYKY